MGEIKPNCYFTFFPQQAVGYRFAAYLCKIAICANLIYHKICPSGHVKMIAYKHLFIRNGGVGKSMRDEIRIGAIVVDNRIIIRIIILYSEKVGEICNISDTISNMGAAKRCFGQRGIVKSNRLRQNTGKKKRNRYYGCNYSIHSLTLVFNIGNKGQKARE